MGIGKNEEILDLFGDEPKLIASLAKDSSENYEGGLLELYKKIRPGEPLSVDNAQSLFNSMFSGHIARQVGSSPAASIRSRAAAILLLAYQT